MVFVVAVEPRSYSPSGRQHPLRMDTLRLGTGTVGPSDGCTLVLR
jgi:hypothetical protein